MRRLPPRLAPGAALDRRLVESAGAPAYENRGTSLARELKIAELRGRMDWLEE